MIHRLRYKFSEPYRIRVGRGLAPIRSEREARALFEFCLYEVEHTDYDLGRHEIFVNTIFLYEYQDEEDWRMIECYCPNHSGIKYWSFYEYVTDHAGWYWS